MLSINLDEEEEEEDDVPVMRETKQSPISALGMAGRSQVFDRMASNKPLQRAAIHYSPLNREERQHYGANHGYNPPYNFSVFSSYNAANSPTGSIFNQPNRIYYPSFARNSPIV